LGLSRGGAAAANLPGCISTWSLSRQPSTSSPRAARSTFYARLFAAAPSVKPLFDGTDLRRQKAMLLGALVLVRKSLRDMDAMLPTLQELGARHVGYGAKPEHYLVVGEVLIASLAEVAGEAWRPEHQLAWAAAFAVIADVMLSGAAEAEVDIAA
jgi:methyl-accepting chemotaxis protein